MMNYVCMYVIGHYNSSVRIIDLVSHTTSVVCGNIILESTPNDSFFFLGNFEFFAILSLKRGFIALQAGYMKSVFEYHLGC